MMKTENLARWNTDLRSNSPLEITRWAIGLGSGRAIVSTNFRPYEAVLLSLCVEVDPNLPVLWVDHGFNRAATYRHAEQLRARLKLNLKTYLPRISAAHYEAVYGPVPELGDEAGLKEFSARMKLEPFQRGMKELGPTVWLTSLRKGQNSHRTELDIVSPDSNFGTIKVSPVFYLTDQEMEEYLRLHHLPNEWDYFDPAKGDEKRECGLHAKWARGMISGRPGETQDLSQCNLSAAQVEEPDLRLTAKGSR